MAARALLPLLLTIAACGGLVTAPEPQDAAPTVAPPEPVTAPVATAKCTESDVGRTECTSFPEPYVCQYVYFEDGSHGFYYRPCYDWDTWCGELVWSACK